MKEWRNPELWILGAKYTEAGGLGGNGDGVHYDINGYDVIGTSGTKPLPYPTKGN
jgi:hypothetical protein